MSDGSSEPRTGGVVKDTKGPLRRESDLPPEMQMKAIETGIERAFSKFLDKWAARAGYAVFALVGAWLLSKAYVALVWMVSKIGGHVS